MRLSAATQSLKKFIDFVFLEKTIFLTKYTSFFITIWIQSYILTVEAKNIQTFSLLPSEYNTPIKKILK